MSRVAVISLALLLGEYSLLGGILLIYKASWLIWLGTQAITVYICWSGTDAIAVAIAWIVFAIWAGAFTKAWPQTLPWRGMFAFSLSLFAVWAIATILAFSLALTKRYLASLGIKNSLSFDTLFFIAEIGIIFGWFIAKLVLLF